MQELENKLEGHAIHVCHGKNGDGRVAGLYIVSQYMLCKIIVAPQCPVWYHHSFGKSRGATGVVDERQFVSTLLCLIFHVLRSEVLRIFLSEESVQVLSGIGERVGA